MQSIRVQFPTDEIIFISLLLEIDKKKNSKCTIAHLKKNYYQVLTCRHDFWFRFVRRVHG